LAVGLYTAITRADIGAGADTAIARHIVFVGGTIAIGVDSVTDCIIGTGGALNAVDLGTIDTTAGSATRANPT
jgi:hypothetical protein